MHAREAGEARVTWADGEEEVFAGPFAAGATHELRRGSGAKR